MEANSMRRTAAALLVGGASLVLGGMAASSVAAQGNGQGGGPQGFGPHNGQQRQGNQQNDAHRQDFLNALAAKLNISADKLKEAMEQTRQEVGGQKGGNGPRVGGPQGTHQQGGPRMGLDAAAKALNISEQQLRQELPCKSLTDIANAHGVSPSTVSNALKAEATSRIDQGVSAGRITAEQAAQMKQGVSQRIDTMMSQAFPSQGQNQRGGPRGGEQGQGAGPQQGRAPSGHRAGGSDMPQSAPVTLGTGGMRL